MKFSVNFEEAQIMKMNFSVSDKCLHRTCENRMMNPVIWIAQGRLHCRLPVPKGGLRESCGGGLCQGL